MNPYVYILSVNGLLFFLSLIFYFFPPKKINHLYGYRTRKSMLNDTIWQFANRYFTKTLVVYAAISFIAALAFQYFFDKEISWQPMAFMLLSLGATVLKTEQAISAHFDDEGHPKN